LSQTCFWLVRHAPVAGPREVIHAADAPADVGDGAAIAGLRAMLPGTATAYASPARRTLDTAAALGLSPAREPRFREQNFGAWTGRRHADLEREAPEAYRVFWDAPASNKVAGGESFAEQIARVRDGLTAIDTPDAVLVVHSGTVRAALAVALDLPPNRALAFVVAPWSLTRLDRTGTGWRVECVNRNPR